MSTQPHKSDDTLIDRCLAGDDGAWSALIQRYAALVHAIPRRLGLTDAECDDVAQTVFTILFHRLDRIQDRQALPKWLITTTRRECWRTLRRRPDHAPMPGDVASEPTSPELDGLERHAAVRTALNGMGERCRDLLLMLFTDSDSPDYDVIAETLDMPRGSIGPTRARCLTKLLDRVRASPDARSLFPEIDGKT